MIPRPRSVDCDVKPSIDQLQQHQLNHYQQQQQSTPESIQNITALLDELFLVLYDPKEIAKLKVKQLHYTQQVPMRLRRLPKSFFNPPRPPAPIGATSAFSARPVLDNHQLAYHHRMKSMGQPVPHHFEYCCQTKATQIQSASGAPVVAAATGNTGPDSKNNIVISSNNHHISFIEGHQYDARMYASIEVTATTLKYQKTLQLPHAHHQPGVAHKSNGPFLPPTNSISAPGNSTTSWDGTSVYQNQPWLNYPRAQHYESSDDSSENEPVNQTGDKVVIAGQSVEYLDLDGFDNENEYAHPNPIDHSTVEPFSGIAPEHSQPFIPTPYQTKPIEFSAYHPPPSASFTQTLEHLPKEPLDHSFSTGNPYDHFAPQPYNAPPIVPPLGTAAPSATNLWNATTSWN